MLNSSPRGPISSRQRPSIDAAICSRFSTVSSSRGDIPSSCSETGMMGSHRNAMPWPFYGAIRRAAALHDAQRQPDVKVNVAIGESRAIGTGQLIRYRDWIVNDTLLFPSDLTADLLGAGIDSVRHLWTTEGLIAFADATIPFAAGPHWCPTPLRLASLSLLDTGRPRTSRRDSPLSRRGARAGSANRRRSRDTRSTSGNHDAAASRAPHAPWR